MTSKVVLLLVLLTVDEHSTELVGTGLKNVQMFRSNSSNITCPHSHIAFWWTLCQQLGSVWGIDLNMPMAKPTRPWSQMLPISARQLGNGLALRWLIRSFALTFDHRDKSMIIHLWIHFNPITILNLLNNSHSIPSTHASSQHPFRSECFYDWITETSSTLWSMAMTQDPIDWRYLPLI